jgi:hypothetical protein
MMQLISWLALALIHATPALAFFRPALITKLYRLDAGSPLFLLFQHRAALFVVIFVICLWAAFDPGSRRLASVAVGISMISFVVLWRMAGSPPALRTIAVTDIVGLPFLAFVAFKAFT